MRRKRFFYVMGAVLLFCACATAPDESPVSRENQPRSILVMPPINRTVDVRAPAVFLASSTAPLADSGYYVIPVALSDTVLKQNGIMAAEEAHIIDYGILRDIFGADAALYITINSFGPSYQILRSVVQVSATARLVDLRNGKDVWTGRISRETSGSDGVHYSGGNIVPQLLIMLGVAAIEQVINVAFDPSEDLARKAIHQVFSANGSRSSIPFGPHHPRFYAGK